MLYTGESIALHLFKQIKGKKVTLCFMKIDFNHFRFNKHIFGSHGVLRKNNCLE